MILAMLPMLRATAMFRASFELFTCLASLRWGEGTCRGEANDCNNQFGISVTDSEGFSKLLKKRIFSNGTKIINCQLLTLHWPIWHAYVQDNKKVLRSIKPTRLVVSWFLVLFLTTVERKVILLSSYTTFIKVFEMSVWSQVVTFARVSGTHVAEKRQKRVIIELRTTLLWLLQ